MVHSMTGFGRGNSEDGGKRSFSIEIKSINHRYLDVNVRMPRTLISLEERIRKYLNEKISRGKIDIFVNYLNYEKQDLVANFNSSLGDSYVKCLEEIRDRYQLRDDISVMSVARFPDILYVEEKQEDLEEIWLLMKQALHVSVDNLIEMRKKEGQKLSEDIIKKCGIISSDLSKIEERSPGLTVQYKQKLSDRIKELLDGNRLEDIQLSENRISLEVALFADRSCIDEEITRLKSHLLQVKETLSSNETIGRKLDFLVQEMNRETNTIASKANDLVITNLALNIKNEIEKIREQIQNIE
jgi:TIGR00255 family protein